MAAVRGKTVIHIIWYSTTPAYGISIKHNDTVGSQTWEHVLARFRPVEAIAACPEGVDPEIWAALCCLQDTCDAQERAWRRPPLF